MPLAKIAHNAKKAAAKAARQASGDELLLRQLGMVFLCMFGVVAVVAGIVFLLFGAGAE